MYKNILFAILSVVAIFHQQYIHSSAQEILEELKAKEGLFKRIRRQLPKDIYLFTPLGVFRKPEGIEEYMKDKQKEALADMEGLRNKMKKLVPEGSCHECTKLSAPYKCGRCEAVCYCDEKCQRTAWNNGHKDACTAAVAPTAAKEAKK